MIHDIETERTVLSTITGCGDLTAWEMASQTIDAEVFYSAQHRRIWEAMERAARTKPLALDSLQIRAHAIGVDDDALLHATGVIGTMRMLPDNLRRLRDLHTVRELGRVGAHFFAEAKQGPENVPDFLDNADRTVTEALRGRMVQSPGKPFRHYAQQVYDRMIALSEGRGRVGLPTGLDALDRIMLGLCPGDLVVVAGRPGMGKSSLAQLMATTNAAEGKEVLVFSLEMPGDQWAARAMSADARVPLRHVRTGEAVANSMASCLASLERLSRMPITMADVPALDRVSLCASARAHRREHGVLDLVVIDYLQLMSGRGDEDGRERVVAESTRAAKLLAKEMGCPVVLLSQLNRKSDDKADKRPELSHLRESGAIEQDADAVILVHRDEVANPNNVDRNTKRHLNAGTAELIVAKNRNGQCGVAEAAWLADFAAFGNLTRRWGDAA